MTFGEILPLVKYNEYVSSLGNLGDDFIEVTFFYTYYSKKTSSFHTVEINPGEYGTLGIWFEDFDNDIDRDDYDEGVETTEMWNEPTEDNTIANWMAHLVWLGPSYDWPDWPELHTDDVEVVKSACNRLYARIEEYKKEHGQ